MTEAPVPPPAADPVSGTATRPATDRRWLVLALMCSGLLLAAMDNTILNVALPAIAESLRPGATGLLWIVDSYSLVVAGLLVTAGTGADRFGRKRFFLLGLALFGVASLVAAFAGSVAVLIAARVLRAVGGAMIMPATLSIIRTVFTDPRERGVAIGLWSATAAVGSVIGPIVAGAMLRVFWWGSVFLVGLPVVVVALLLSARYVPESRDPSPGRFDPISVVLSMGAVLGVVFGIKELAGHGIGAPTAVPALALGLVLAWVFVRRQGKLAHPLLDLSLFRAPRFTAATLAVLLSFFGFFGLLFFLAQYFQILRGFTTLQTGLWLLPMAVASLVAAPLTEKMVRNWGTRLTLSGCFGVIAVSLAVLSLIGADVPGWVVDGAIVVGFIGVGFGASVAVTSGSQAIMTSAPPARAGGAAAIQETSFELGAGLGVALLGSIMAAVFGNELAATTVVAPAVAETAAQSLPLAALTAAEMGAAGEPLMAAARAAFLSGISVAALVGAGVMLVTSVLTALWLPNRAAERAEAAASPGGW
ncbi:MFS transporter [Actinokineospora auranticolor]|uniref:DHA2 family multidrug resistance protein-like MFS transporter n=1 Tax=Actinokineospora auranticolor TaxID=155976 RepID=A0A2S6GPE4_9PSEU|nr:MFS transporter [Actinokineospora auranticolor]PPK67104.1 DHA2 family multidrug resistance protein-like MFS transporter [Actinokineospora auranticolor]